MPSIRIRKPNTLGRRIDSTPRSPLKLVTVKDAAIYCKVSTQTIRRAIKSGALKIYRAGKQIRIDEADITKYLCQ